MKNNNSWKKSSLFFAAFLFLFSANLRADVFKGEITKAADEKQSFTIIYEDPSKTKKEIHIWITPETKFLGLSTLTEMINGDEVTVSAEMNTHTSHWEADSVELTKAMIRNPAPEAPVTEALSDEKEIRSVEEKAAKPYIDLNEVEKRLAELTEQIDGLEKKAAKNASLQEKTDVLMTDLKKKRETLKAAVEECHKASPDQLPALTQKAIKAAEKLDASFLTANAEIAADKTAVI